MSFPAVPIVTERLVLRPWEHDDVDAMGAAIAASIDHLRPWMAWIAFEPLDREQRLEVISRFRREFANDESLTLGIFRDGEVVGGTGLHRRSGSGEVSIGYWVHADHIGQGIATEAADALTALALVMDGVATVDICHDIANYASGRVPAKLGYTNLGGRPAPVQAPGETGTHVYWVRHRADG